MLICICVYVTEYDEPHKINSLNIFVEISLKAIVVFLTVNIFFNKSVIPWVYECAALSELQCVITR